MFWLGFICYLLAWFSCMYSTHRLMNGPLRTWRDLWFYMITGYSSAFEMGAVLYLFLI